jgi:diaminohydroxyphosphoribosylaminopyrimidine deaminase/5-amino-6-(5-phosphoribosylamino)uracil reductase
VPLLIACTVDDADKKRQLEELGCEVVRFTQSEDQVDLRQVLQELGRREIDSVLIEGGPTLLGAAFDAGVVQAVCCYIAPKLFGGSDAPSPIGGRGVSTPGQSIKLKNSTITMFGEDIAIEGEVE